MQSKKLKIAMKTFKIAMEKFKISLKSENSLENADLPNKIKSDKIFDRNPKVKMHIFIELKKNHPNDSSSYDSEAFQLFPLIKTNYVCPHITC